MTLAAFDQNTIIHNPRGREVEYRVVYETEVSGNDSPLVIDLGALPSWSARYRIRIEVEQMPPLEQST